MQTQIEFIVNNSVDRKPLKVRIFHAGTENIIKKDDCDKLDSEALKVWLMLGLSKTQIQEIVGFLRS